MKITAVLRAWAAVALAAFVVACGQAQDLKSLKGAYEKNVDALKEGFQPKFDALQQQYETSLETLKSDAQTQGDLKTTKAVIAEIERFQKTKTLPARPDESTLPMIQSLQSVYVKNFSRLELSRISSLDILTSQYGQALDCMLKELTKAGQLENTAAVEAEQAKVLTSAKGNAEKMAALKGLAATRATSWMFWRKPVTDPWITVAKKERYLVIDLSRGPKADKYPVTVLEDMPKRGWTQEYKTDNLVLRRLEPGTFTMGSSEDELGHMGSETLHKVTLTKAFYIGVFEVTQKQWERVMGDWPSAFNAGKYREARPVDQVSFNTIRGAVEGAHWPATNAVDAGSFLGRLRALTGLAVDLPTEAQWEYACRAGTLTALSSGKDLTGVERCKNLSELGRYTGNRRGGDTSNIDPREGGSALVGSYLPSAWGLYDMHGNLLEWCLDWHGNYYGDVNDPVGERSGSGRVVRGGGWRSPARFGRSANRQNRAPDFRDNDLGFRVAITLQQP